MLHLPLRGNVNESQPGNDLATPGLARKQFWGLWCQSQQQVLAHTWEAGVSLLSCHKPLLSFQDLPQFTKAMCSLS